MNQNSLEIIFRIECPSINRSTTTTTASTDLRRVWRPEQKCVCVTWLEFKLLVNKQYDND